MCRDEPRTLLSGVVQIHTHLGDDDRLAECLRKWIALLQDLRERSWRGKSRRRLPLLRYQQRHANDVDNVTARIVRCGSGVAARGPDEARIGRVSGSDTSHELTIRAH